MDIILLLLTVTVVPIVINKTTERGRFDFLHPWLREIWVALLVFYTYYLLSRPPVEGFMVGYRRYGKSLYLVTFVAGGVLLSLYWWVTGWALKETSSTAPPPSVAASERPKETTKKKIAVEPVLKPIVKTGSFTTLIPINVDAPTVPIPIDENWDDPMRDFYSELSNLALVPGNAAETGWPVVGGRKIATDGDRFEFAAELIQFYLLTRIQRIHRGSHGLDTHIIGPNGETVVTPMVLKAVVPPESTPYPSAKLLELVKGNQFLTPSAKMILERVPYPVPAGTSIHLAGC